MKNKIIKLLEKIMFIKPYTYPDYLEEPNQKKNDIVLDTSTISKLLLDNNLFLTLTLLKKILNDVKHLEVFCATHFHQFQDKGVISDTLFNPKAS